MYSYARRLQDCVSMRCLVPVRVNTWTPLMRVSDYLLKTDSRGKRKRRHLSQLVIRAWNQLVTLKLKNSVSLDSKNNMNALFVEGERRVGISNIAAIIACLYGNQGVRIGNFVNFYTLCQSTRRWQICNSTNIISMYRHFPFSQAKVYRSIRTLQKNYSILQ